MDIPFTLSFPLKMPLTHFSSFLVVGVLFAVSYLLTRKRRPHNLPPGPKGIPILGNALQISLSRTWLQFTEWADKFGDVLYLEAAGQPIVVLNTATAAHDLLDKREYSERPHLVMAGDLCGYLRSFALKCNDADFKAQRKLVAPAFSASAMPTYHRIQEDEAIHMALDCIRDSRLLRDHVQLRIGRIICFIVYGYEVPDLKDPIFATGIQTMEDFIQATSPGAFLVDAIPFLQYLPKWFPGAGFLLQAEKWKVTNTKSSSQPYEWCQSKLGQLAAVDTSLCGKQLLKLEAEGETKTQVAEHIQWASSSMMGGGMDTNMSAVLSFFRMMVLHPDIQDKARRELDNVVGRERLPRITDNDNLTYVKSLITEVLRTGPPGPLGLPHSVKDWQTYGEFTIPGDSIVIANIWRMMHDPQTFPNPDTFDPDRYDSSEAKMKPVHDLVFGFGRRACPGLHLAEGNLFAFVAMILATCEILPAKDVNGQDIVPGTEFTSGTIAYPEPFDCVIRVRSPDAMELLLRGLSGEGMVTSPSME